MKKNLYKEVIALAGMIQAAELVDRVANTGSAPATYFDTSLQSILQLNTATIEDIYGGQANHLPGLALGLETLRSMLEDKNHPGSSRLRYTVGLLHLQSKLQGDKAVMAVLRSRLEKMEAKLQFFDIHHEQSIAALASIYEDTLSTFRYRIQVNGDRRHLENQANANRIRSLLLAGIRSAMLWRQVGGKRWHFFIYRKQLLDVVKSLT